MGYDMYWVIRDSGAVEEREDAQREFERAVAARDALPKDEEGMFAGDMPSFSYSDHSLWVGRTQRFAEAQDAVAEASKKIRHAENYYFRANIGGMGQLIDVMYEFGMVFEDEGRPDWPEPKEFNLTREQMRIIYDPEEYAEEYLALTPEVLKQGEEFKAEIQRLLTWHGKTDTPGIPLHKFSTNDGWLVLPAEAEAVVRMWRGELHRDEARAQRIVTGRLGRVGALEWWESWIAFLDGAVSHGGFEVH